MEVHMLYCSKCGNQMNDQDKYCMKCGTAVKTSSTEQENATSPVLNQALIDSLKNKIASGDCVAMYQLGLYYESLDESIVIDDTDPQKLAVKYFKQAANAGHVGGVLKMCGFKQSLIELMEDAYGAKTNEVINEKIAWIQLCSKGVELLQEHAPGSESIKIADFIDYLNKARYSYAYSLYLSNETDKALQLVSMHNENDMSARVLEAWILDEKADAKIDECYDNITAYSEENLADIIQQKRDSINRMSIILNNDQYGLKNKSLFEEFTYARVTLALANFYRKVENDRAKSINILKYVRQFLKNENVTVILDNDIARYITLGSGRIVYKHDDGSIE